VGQIGGIGFLFKVPKVNYFNWGQKKGKLSRLKGPFLNFGVILGLLFVVFGH